MMQGFSHENELGGDPEAVRRARRERDARLSAAERLRKLDALLRGAAALRGSVVR